MRRILAMSAILAAFAGCCACPHRANYDCLASDICPEPPACQRNGVVAILVGPELDLGWGKLANRIHEAGFAKVLRGSTLQMPLLSDQARKLIADDASIRFVVIGYDMGTVAARELTHELLAAGAQVDHCVYLDPWTTVARRPLPPTVAVTVVRSHGWTRGLFPEAADRIVPGVGHFDLPTHAETIAAVTALMQSSAESVVREAVANPMPTDPTAPPLPATRPGHLGSDWDFLLGPSQGGPSKPKLIPERTASR